MSACENTEEVILSFTHNGKEAKMIKDKTGDSFFYGIKFTDETYSSPLIRSICSSLDK